MNAVTAFILGLIVGWVIEWIIDWVYWRRRTAEMTRRMEHAEARLSQTAEPIKSEGIKSDLENQLSALKQDNAALQEKVAALEAQNMAFRAPAASVPEPAPVPLPQAGEPKIFEEINPNLTDPSVRTNAVEAAPQENAPEFQAGNPPLTEAAASRLGPVPGVPDDLIVIKGIGPVIARKLNAAGIYTFRQLAALTPVQLREIVGDVIQRLADEDDIINQAKELAAKQDRTAIS
jgi:predicted flap endonuclease-1-like 5' DNA nuclease